MANKEPESIRTWWGNVQVGDMVIFRDEYSDREVTVLGQDPQNTAYIRVIGNLGVELSVHKCFCRP